jgi:hypothetical protein
MLVSACPALGAERLDFAIKIRDLVIPYPVFGVTALPGEPVEFAVQGGGEAGDYGLATSGGDVTREGKANWTWTAPEQPGWHVLRVRRKRTESVMRLNMFITRPRLETKRDGRLNGYRLGVYPVRPFRGLDAYRPPSGFIEVTRETKDVRVSPHFRLGEFVSKQWGRYPRYVALRGRLLLYLEAIIEEARAQGMPASSMVIMSGFRTPYYNARIGQGRHSRHQWGDAADIYIDARPPRARMDDLNGDGRRTYADARRLARVAARVQGRDGPVSFVGGIGIYGSRSHRGPFVHVDTRGYRARWRYP